MFESGVDWYAHGVASFPVYFPEGQACCRYCRFCKYSKDFNTYRCLLTEEFLFKELLDERGQRCPITFEKTEF